MIYWFSLDYIQRRWPDAYDRLLDDPNVLKSPLSVSNGMYHPDLANTFETALKQASPEWPRSIAVRGDHPDAVWLLIGTQIK